MSSPLPRLLPLILLLIVGTVTPTRAETVRDPWARSELQAWCIVPYDSAKRTPPQRARMLQELGLRFFAYDFRPVHIPTFDEEVTVMKQNKIEVSAWWFPMQLDETARTILATIERHGIHPELWVMRSGPAAATPLEHQARIQKDVDALRPIVLEARRLGLKVGLYNHGGWFGDPENQVLVLQRLRAEGFENIGLVYNFHHAHDHIRNFDKIWPRISPYVLAVNLNGMVVDGDRQKKKILFVGEGTEELSMIRVIQRSGWQGRVGVVSHIVEADAAETLRRNLEGYDRLMAKLKSEPAPVPPLPSAARK